MKRRDLIRAVGHILERCGGVAIQAELEDEVKFAAELAFARCLTEDDDTRAVRWQVGELIDNGDFNLED